MTPKDSIACLASRVAGGGLRVGEVIGASQAAIDQFNPAWRALSHRAADVEAQADALQRELDAGRARGPLHGMAVTVKGNIPVAGLLRE